MNAILVMNLTGSTMLVGYFLMKKLGAGRLPRRVLYAFLQATVVAFLVPLNFLGEVYKTIRNWLPIPRAAAGPYSPEDFLLIQMDGRIRTISHGLRTELKVLAVYLAVALVHILFWLIMDYRSQRKFRRALSFCDGKEDALLERMRKDYGIRGSVTCLHTENRMAAVMGLLHPILIMKDPEEETERELILAHELCHVKRRDVLWHMAARLVRFLHLWNPFVYLLSRELKILCEQSCDEWVMKDRDAAHRQVYANLLVDYSGPYCLVRGGAMITLAERRENRRGEETRLRDRLCLILKPDQHRRMDERAGVLLAVCLLGVCSLTTLAYEEVQIYAVEEKSLNAWTHGGSVTGYIIGPDDPFQLGEVLYSKQYTTTTGQICELDETKDAACDCQDHVFEKILLSSHEQDGDGGCLTIWYMAERCENCGELRDVRLINKMHEMPCQHHLK